MDHLVGQGLGDAGHAGTQSIFARQCGQGASQPKRPASHEHNLTEPDEKFLNHRFGDFLDNDEITS
ncbi:MULTISPECIES: hypothetical protein [Aminobacter]|jgi:hypothetical protein|uniref:Transposase n=1 Tax=Aminobacter ciceronei TaxID=150723 RepID=A0ABR6C3B7_9HYPH|nr:MULTISPECIES: hypothetical protein [Aminobacter]MBA8905685.1 hypothetical protein [Aminobacter ciceronei]MBA9019464.1 hypothetical protein [Aminobacter ciceronei]